MSTMTLELQGQVHVLTLTNNDGENKLNMDVMGEYMQALDTVEAYAGNTALLLRCEDEKTFSTGIDLDWMLSLNDADRSAFVLELERVLYRVALLNAPTIACLNGNTYAGGAILATAFDFRVMRADRGRFCYPEVNIKIPFTPLMSDIINLLPNKHHLKILAQTGKAYTGEECLEADVVDALFPIDQLQSGALGLASMLAEKDRTTYTAIRNPLRDSITHHAAHLGMV